MAAEAGTVFRDTLKDGSQCPEMVIIPAGEFWMGSDKTLDSEPCYNELPRHRVTIDEMFALGRYPVTFDEYDYFARATDRKLPKDRGWGRGNRPVINVSWENANAYTKWLSKQTGKSYRLPTEAEWEYGARAGTKTHYWWGDTFERNRAANCSTNLWEILRRVVTKKTTPVGSFEANPFGLYDTAGNVREWVEDCWHASYEGAPTDGSAWLEQGGGNCGKRLFRGGSWHSEPQDVRSAGRADSAPTDRYFDVGFRLAKDL
jgi:formylglycine-generating enzyme required for sulfatase activity